MKKLSAIFILTLLFLPVRVSLAQSPATDPQSSLYLNNRAPLKERPYLQLPLGAIRPGGWLKEQLQRMKTGLTGHLDQKYASVVGSRNAWLGGDGDAWERGQLGRAACRERVCQ